MFTVTLGTNHPDMEKVMLLLQELFNVFNFTGKFSNLLLYFAGKQSNQKAFARIISK